MGQFTDAQIRSAAPGYHWESDGFGYRVSSKGTRTFVVNIGGGRKKKLGRYPLMTLAQARQLARNLKAEIQLGKIIPTRTAFEDARKEYLEDCTRRLKAGTVTQYSWCLNQLPFGRKALAEITGRELGKLLKGMGESNREHCHRAWRTFFTWAVEQELIPHSPMEKMGAPQKGKSRERVLTEDELKAIYTWARKLKTPHQRFMWLMLRFGQRPGETIRFHHDFIREDRIVLPSTLVGNKKSREHAFPITRADYSLLKTFPDLDGKLFPPARTHVRGKPCVAMALNQEFRETLLTETDTSGWVPNDARRTLSTLWAETLEVPPHLIERQLNHVSGQISGVAATYNRARYVEQIRPHMERWFAYLESLALSTQAA